MHSLVKGADNPDQIITPPRRNESKTRTRRDGERFGRFQILDYGTKINGFRIEGLVLCDLRPVQHLETITFEHLLSAPTLEGDDLAVNPFLARAIEITQVRAHQGASRRNPPRVRQEIDVKMRRASRCRRNLAPSVHQDPANKAARPFIVPEIARQGAEK